MISRIIGIVLGCLIALLACGCESDVERKEREYWNEYSYRNHCRITGVYGWNSHVWTCGDGKYQVVHD